MLGSFVPLARVGSVVCWYIYVSLNASMNLNSSFSVFSPGVVQLSQFILGVVKISCH